MTDRRATDSRRRQLTQQAYLPRPVRSLAVQIAIPLIIYLIGMATGGAITLYEPHASHLSCPAAPSRDALTAELMRTQLALEQERASHAAVQKQVDASAAELMRAKNELRVLREGVGRYEAAPKR
ncbi:hypothetical protein LFL97_32295 [Burkholderia sp. JSH-S8]|nr:hypothetical protein LFL97_32295 [Burkholderia sp. JSH-S8]